MASHWTGLSSVTPERIANENANVQGHFRIPKIILPRRTSKTACATHCAAQCQERQPMWSEVKENESNSTPAVVRGHCARSGTDYERVKLRQRARM